MTFEERIRDAYKTYLEMLKSVRPDRREMITGAFVHSIGRMLREEEKGRGN